MQAGNITIVIIHAHTIRKDEKKNYIFKGKGRSGISL